MDALKEPEIEIGSSMESFLKLMDSQRELVHNQIDQLQRIVVTQCKLTGVNPLSQEMAAGALSIKIGKRPRDLLNPKAVNYMQAIFSIKDSISKKESREISALFGVTVAQVRDFFNSQRTRVRKLVRLSREKASRSNVPEESYDRNLTSSDSMIPLDVVPVNSLGPTSIEEAPSCSKQDDALPGLDDMDKYFVENIFILMRKEDTFSGQVKLMEWILQIQNSSVLYWFLTKGGVMILATWLSQAAVEEQTSVLLVILKVLCHLPLHKSLPEQMSAILQSVNSLRFYRTSDISNRARVLLSRWSKIFARSQAMKKPNGRKSSSEAQNEVLLKQSIGEIMGDGLWPPNTDIGEGALVPAYEGLENSRKLESPQALKLLPASTYDSARKHILGFSSAHNRERRKVQLVEQPGQKMAGRSPHATRAVPVSQGRPMSADDIQKAKMRAHYMQSKYGKNVLSAGSNETKTEGLNRPLTTQASILPPVSKVHVQPKNEEHKKPEVFPTEVSNRIEPHFDAKQKMDSVEPLWERCKRVQIPWKTPPEMLLNDLWRVGDGENSKEVDVQRNRNRREGEIIYRTAQEIPSNPKEPWDVEMDYDDTLTPDIPTEQPPDADAAETQIPHDKHGNSKIASVPSSSQIGAGSPPEPDLELLAVLLKNPELVFALTSGQAGNLSSKETVRLLDMIKAGGAGFAGNLSGFNGKVEEKVEVSLPSPTPPSNPGTVRSGWKPDEVRNPFSQRSPVGNVVAYTSPGVTTKIPTVEKLPFNSTTKLQQHSSESSLSQQVPTAISPFSFLHTSTIVPQKHVPITTGHASERRFPCSPSLPVQTKAQQPPFMSNPSHNYRPPVGNLGPVYDSWEIRQGLVLNPRSHANQNNYNASYTRPVPSQMMSNPPWEGDGNVVDGGFESWSPENSPTRSAIYTPESNSVEPRMNFGWNYRPDRSRQRNSAGYRDNNWPGNGRWQDRRN
ncbi:hypothetical protein CFOL_v3_26810 [Cephalotus follicularis]|uniref:Homeobox domain-containing protein n=1 Tax=Cephalotus follicularis TaxID=3775 RepID=A0A1Q3CT69_CEPFO|nr:hypothetical protein CFOL_v3_26810 [Cephalotus follicularis]